MGQIQAAINAGWKVTVVAKYVDVSLRDRVTWLPLTVPPRLFYLQWTTARHFIRGAMGNRKFDIIHAHQPQVADLSDVFHCHFLTRVAYERKCLETRRTLRARFIRLQQQGVLYAEDRCFRRWNPATRMIFISDMLRDEFHRLYSQPPLEEVIPNPCPPMREISPEDRRTARTRWVGDRRELVIGYLGGRHERKGYRRLLAAVADYQELFLLMAGPHCDGFSDPALNGRMRSVGLVDDISSFYAACDVIALPSLFEPLGMVAFEAAAHGVPVIATEEVGALPHLLEFGAGARWNPAQPLGPIARDLVQRKDAIRAGARHMAQELSEQHHYQRVLGIYDQVIQSKSQNRLVRTAE